uniref:Uncharacterized protein n=1 Tax=Oryza glumipatula TaxID=40148 RepID=A0A0E0BPH1_9ORYZ
MISIVAFLLESNVALHLNVLMFSICYIQIFMACAVANDELLVIGGQEEDFMAKPESPIFKCVRSGFDKDHF